MEISGIGASSFAAQPKQLPNNKMVPESKAQAKHSNNKRESKEREGRKPTGVKRATQWNEEVEEQYRLQQVGWRNLDEYIEGYGEPERWDSNNFVKCLRVKKSGHFTYWREWRECEDKYLSRVKVFTYN